MGQRMGVPFSYSPEPLVVVVDKKMRERGRRQGRKKR